MSITRFILFVLVFLLQIRPGYSQWKQLPVSTGVAKMILYDDSVKIKYLIANNQVFKFKINSWEKLSGKGLPNVNNMVIKAATAFNNRLIIGVNALPKAGFYEFNPTNNHWDKLDFLIKDSFSIRSMFSVNNRLYVSFFDYKIVNPIPGIFYKENNGSDWHSDVNGLLSPTIENMDQIYFFDNHYFLITNAGLYRKLQSDTVWKVFDNGLPINFLPRNMLIHQNQIYLCALKGYFKLNMVTEYWESMNEGLLPDDTAKNARITQLNNKIITYGSNSIGNRRGYFFNEGLNKWERMLAFDSLTINLAANINDTLFVATEQGLYFITAIHEIPKPFNKGVHNVNVTNLIMDNGVLYGSVYSSGVLKYSNGNYNEPDIISNIFNTYCNSVLVASGNILIGTTKGLGIYNENLQLQYFEPLFYNTIINKLAVYGNKIHAMVGPSNQSTHFVADVNTLDWKSTGLNTTIRHFYSHQGYFYAGSTTTGLYRADTANLFHWVNLSGDIFPKEIRGLAASGNLLYVNSRDGINTYNVITGAWDVIETPFEKFEFGRIAVVNEKIITSTLLPPGLYTSNVNNLDFYPIYSGIDANWFEVNDILAHNDTLFLATNQGIWYRPVNQINTAVNNIAQALSTVSVFPNPATHEVKIASSQFPFQSLFVYNTLGQQLDEIKCQGMEYTYDSSQLKEGIYFFNVLLNNQNWVHQKVVICR